MVLLQPTSETFEYLPQPPQVDSISSLQRLQLCWFLTPGLQLDSKVAPLMDQLLWSLDFSQNTFKWALKTTARRH